MAAAIERAKQLGLVYDLQQSWHCWAIAMLKETTQFSAPVMRGMLQLECLGCLAVVTLSRNTVMKFDSVDRLKPPKREEDYLFRPWDQQTGLPGARVAIAVLHESTDPSWTLADPEFNVILT
jgi:hypothetical protein